MAKQLSCGVEFMRGLLLFLNILFIIVGLALIGLGIYIKVDNNFSTILDKFTNLNGVSSQVLGFFAFAMIGGGVFTLLLALLGCMGSLWHNRCLLYMYAVILAILMIIEIVAFIMAFVYKGKIEEAYKEPLLTLLTTAVQGDDTTTLNVFYDLENSLECCGVNNKSDYGNFTTLSKRCNEHPESKGCGTVIIAIFEKNLPIIGGTLGGVVVLELFGLIAAFVLAKALKNAPDDHYSSRPGDVLGGLVGRRN